MNRKVIICLAMILGASATQAMEGVKSAIQVRDGFYAQTPSKVGLSKSTSIDPISRPEMLEVYEGEVNNDGFPNGNGKAICTGNSEAIALIMAIGGPNNYEDIVGIIGDNYLWKQGGEWRDGHICGQGTMTFPNGTTFEGFLNSSEREEGEGIVTTCYMNGIFTGPKGGKWKAKWDGVGAVEIFKDLVGETSGRADPKE